MPEDSTMDGTISPLLGVGFAKEAVKGGIKYALKPALTQTAKGTAKVGRAIVTGDAKVELIAGAAKVTVRDITPLVRSGIQIRQATIFAAKKTPDVVYGTVKVVAKMAARDTLAPYYGAVHTYSAIRYSRQLRGVSTALERGVDLTIRKSAQTLDRVGLAPSLRGTAGIAVRGALGISLYQEAPKIARQAKESYDVIYGEVTKVKVSVVAPKEAPPIPAPIQARATTTTDQQPPVLTKPTTAPPVVTPTFQPRPGQPRIIASPPGYN